MQASCCLHVAVLVYSVESCASCAVPSHAHRHVLSVWNIYGDAACLVVGMEELCANGWKWLILELVSTAVRIVLVVVCGCGHPCGLEMY